ncbi:hydrogenase [Caproiciproducens sp. NJN-50]|uniref:nitrogenase component 1 n=1 Tax=Acutalibacteraceae TaxID=3082771 RepID=UPI000FFE1BCD|nr:MULTISPECIES: nitrogenase component 1 [Acutalibacteraceae]QAT50411.1 hydrogenase [Caproiciproducens sp. NJN-50]
MSAIIEQPRYTCALGSQQTVLAIPKGIPIVHAGPGCSSKIFQYENLDAGFQGEGYAGGGAVSCTNTSEQEVVFGGEEKLKALVRNTFKIIKGDLFVILSGCTAGIVGDDVKQVASQFASQGKPIVGVDTSGFRGNNYYGHELVVNEIINQFIGDAVPRRRERLVNVFSVVPNQDPFWRADLEEIKRLLAKLGLEVNILFGDGSNGVSEWEDIPNAQFNLILSPWVCLSTAKLLKEKYGTPYLHYPILPVGAKATGAFLRTVAEFAGVPKEHAEAVIKEEEKRFYHYLVSLGDFIADLRNNIPYELYAVADSAYAIGTSDFLVNELGFIPRGIYATENPSPSGEQRIRKAWSLAVSDYPDALSVEADGGMIQADIRAKIGESNRAVILGSTWESRLAAEHNNLLIHLSLPIADDVIVNRSFTGYNGGLRLMEEIYSGIFRKGNISQTTQTAKASQI